MIRRIRKFARWILPHWLVSLLRPVAPGITFSGPYKSWADAARDAGGYDAPAILQKVRESALAVKQGKAAFERDSVAFNIPEYRWPMLACLFHIALEKDGSNDRAFHVADFGGSLGSVYFQHRTFFDRMPAFLWSVIEQPHFVQCGNAEIADERLHFFNGIAEAKARAPIDVVLFAGSLQYLENPHAILSQAAALASPYLILDRLLLTDAADDRIKVQRVRPPIYDASYPIRVFAVQKLKAHLNAIGYEIVATLPGGFFCRRKSN